MTELVLAGGLLVDGTGAPPRTADVHVRAGRVAAIAEPGQLRAPAARTVDARGAVVCPGFVDIHTHSDLTVLSGPSAASKVHQGVTTEVVGNCGLGVAPVVAGVDVRALREAVGYLDLDPALSLSWSSTGDYLRAVAAAGPSVNIATLTGHLPLRAGIVGFADRAPSAGERATLRALLAESFDQGSLGLSTGLVYAPLCYARQEELLDLGRTVAEYDRFFAWHVRDYADDLLPSVRQAIEVGERSGCRIQISHLVAVGRRNWGSVAAALDLVDSATERGVRIGVDVYPYLYGNAPLAQLLPAWVQEGGPDAMTARLRETVVRERIRTEWTTRPLGWEEITISRVPSDSPATALVGQTVADAAGTRDGDDLVLDLLAELGTAVQMVAGGRSARDLAAVLAHPATVVASDGQCLDPSGVTGRGVPHPRSYGCFPRYLADFAPHAGTGLADAVARCTSAPARVAGLTDRGTLRVDAPADIVVYHRDRLADTATFAQPQRFPAGVELVLVNGEPVIDATVHTGLGPGVTLRKGEAP